MESRMIDLVFKQQQWQSRYDGHIAPFNHLVDDLKKQTSRGWAPYVAPMYGGINARLLSVLRDPGPATQGTSGSGFLCMENNDPTVKTLKDLFLRSEIDAHDIVPWNVYPWYINRAPNTQELDAGVEPLKRIIDLMPNLQVIMLHGGHARKGWKRLTRRYPHLISNRKLHVIATYHTSRQAFWHSNPEVVECRRQHLRAAFEEASQLLLAAH